MFEAITRIYNSTSNKFLVKNAVTKGWIRKEEYKEITGEDLAV
ncbi:XkdX family protein [Anaerotignum sp.]|nr:XkdX family protein [Anaerotignum sp.]